MSRPPVIYSLPKVYGTGPCVYRLAYGDHFVIVKAKDHQKSVEGIQKALNQFMRQSELQRQPTNLYFHFFSHIEKKKRSDGIFTVEILMEGDNQYELLKKEQEELDDNVKNTHCLNNNITAYIPQYNETTGLYGWISKGAYLNFQKWLKARGKPKKIGISKITKELPQ